MLLARLVTTSSISDFRALSCSSAMLTSLVNVRIIIEIWTYDLQSTPDRAARIRSRNRCMVSREVAHNVRVRWSHGWPHVLLLDVQHAIVDALQFTRVID